MAEGNIFEAFGASDSPRVAHYSEGLYPVVSGSLIKLSAVQESNVQSVLEGIRAELAKNLLNVEHIMHVRVELAGPVGNSNAPSDAFSTMNEGYRSVFVNSNPPPTRDTAGGCELSDGAQVRMTATVWKPGTVETGSEAPVIPVTLSGIVGKNIATGSLVTGGVEPEAECVFGEIQRQLNVIGLDKSNITYVRVMLAEADGDLGSSFDDSAIVHKVLKRELEDCGLYPEIEIIRGCQLLDDARVEMVATALKPNVV